MTPDKIKSQIEQEFAWMIKCANRGKINHSAIEGIIESRARDGARHNGVPEMWFNYMPETIRKAANPVKIALHGEQKHIEGVINANRLPRTLRSKETF